MGNCEEYRADINLAELWRFREILWQIYRNSAPYYKALQNICISNI